MTVPFSFPRDLGLLLAEEGQIARVPRFASAPLGHVAFTMTGGGTLALGPLLAAWNAKLVTVPCPGCAGLVLVDYLVGSSLSGDHSLGGTCGNCWSRIVKSSEENSWYDHRALHRAMQLVLRSSNEIRAPQKQTAVKVVQLRPAWAPRLDESPPDGWAEEPYPVAAIVDALRGGDGEVEISAGPETGLGDMTFLWSSGVLQRAPRASVALVVSEEIWGEAGTLKLAADGANSWVSGSAGHPVIEAINSDPPPGGRKGASYVTVRQRHGRAVGHYSYESIFNEAWIPKWSFKVELPRVLKVALAGGIIASAGPAP